MNLPFTNDATLADCLCLACGSGRLEKLTAAEIRCTGCGEDYDAIDGVPCLVRYQDHETLSLIEILANLGEKRAPPTPQTYRLWWEMLEAVHASDDSDAAIDAAPDGYRKFLPHRYRQFKIYKDLSEQDELLGAKVLDLGAGEGFSTAMLRYRGAKVTAAEFNPHMCSAGRLAVDARWITASAHSLPFVDESFDYVFCQAALHHVADVPRALSEALRVLRPGGAFFTISDSYRPNSAGEEFEWRRFDRDVAVLRGVNERIPRFEEFVSALVPHAPNLQVTMQTSRVFDYIDPETGARTVIDEPRDWQFPEDVATLSSTSGGVSFRIRKLRSLPIKRVQSDALLVRPRDFLGGTREASMARLARHMPLKHCDMPFPGPAGNSKFDLLNGWMQRSEGEDFRRGYIRARRFITRRAEDRSLFLRLSPETRATTISIYVDGRDVADAKIAPGAWSEITVDLSTAPIGKPFTVELRLKQPSCEFEDNVFRVGRFETIVSSSSRQAQSARAGLSNPK